jgi:hypothetical protein
MTSNVTRVGTELLGMSQKAINPLAIALLESVKVGWNVNDVPQTRCRLKHCAGRKKLAGTSDCRKQDLRRQLANECIDHEHSIRTRYRASMNPAQLSQLNVTARHLPERTS